MFPKLNSIKMVIEFSSGENRPNHNFVFSIVTSNYSIARRPFVSCKLSKTFPMSTLSVYRFFVHFHFSVIFHWQVSALPFFCETTTFISRLSLFNDFYFFSLKFFTNFLTKKFDCFLWRQIAWKCIKDEI